MQDGKTPQAPLSYGPTGGDVPGDDVACSPLLSQFCHVKVCGLTHPDDIRLAQALGAGSLGVIHVPGTPRHVGLVEWLTLIQTLEQLPSPPRLTLVVQLPQERPQLADWADQVKQLVALGGNLVEAVQWHSFYDHHRRLGFSTLRSALAGLLTFFPDPFPPPILTFPYGHAGCPVSDEDWTWALAHSGVLGVKALLLDLPKTRVHPEYPKVDPGQDLDRLMSLAHQMGDHVPVWLAGGLTPENVLQRLRQFRPQGVDVASGVEATPGRKDEMQCRAFFDAVTQYCRNA